MGKIKGRLRITQSESVTLVKIQTLIWKNTVVEKHHHLSSYLQLTPTYSD